MKKALSQISKSPFTRRIKKAKLPRRFHQPTFAMYNGRTDPVEHVSQFKQKMVVHSQDEALMCRVFLFSLRPMPMRWFDELRTNSISSFKKLTQSFYSQFIIRSRVPQPLDSLLSGGLTNVPQLSSNLKTIQLGRRSCLALSQIKSCLPTLLWPLCCKFSTDTS